MTSAIQYFTKKLSDIHDVGNDGSPWHRTILVVAFYFSKTNSSNSKKLSLLLITVINDFRWMYVQHKKDAKSLGAKTDLESGPKPEENSVIADVILSTAPKEAQIGSPLGSPMMNGIRNRSNENGVIKETKDKNKEGEDKNVENGVTNPAFEMEKWRMCDSYGVRFNVIVSISKSVFRIGLN